VLKDNAVTIHATVKGTARDVQTEITPPPGWTAHPLAEREGSWRLLLQRGAQEGEAEITARLTSQDGKTRSFQTRGWTFLVREDQTPDYFVLRIRDSLPRKACSRFEMLSNKFAGRS